MVYFESLPQEIHVEILCHLDYLSLLRCASTCRSLYRTCQDSLELQYIIELCMDGMNDSGSTVPHFELLSRLRDLRGAWEVIRWKRMTKLTIPDICLAYELVAGVFALSDGVGLKIIWLPSATDNGRTLARPSLGIPVRDFAIDPTQDLVIVLEDDHGQVPWNQTRHVRIHVKTVSTNEIHPLARQAILSFTIPPDLEYGNSVYSAMLQVAYDVVALFFAIGGAPLTFRLMIWNWREGALLYDSEQFGPEQCLPAHISDFSLLSRSSFILTSTLNSGALLLYTFPPSSSASSSHSSPTSPSTLQLQANLAAALHLPPIRPTYQIRKLTIHSGPMHANPPDSACFSTSPESHIQVISVGYISTDPNSSRMIAYSLFVHDRTLVGYIQRSQSGSGSGSGFALDVEWGSWGEMNTRFIPTPTSMHWLRYIHGQRVICSSSTSDVVSVLDFNFNPNPNARSTSSTSTSAPNHPIQRHSRSDADASSIYPQYLFKHNFSTRLPYQVSMRGMGQRFYSCMIDEERLVGLKFENGEMELYAYSF